MKKILLFAIAILSVSLVNAQITGGGSKQSPQTKAAVKKKNDISRTFISIGFRTAVGTLGKDLSEGGWGGKSGVGFDFGKQYKVADLVVEGLSTGVDLSYVTFTYLHLNRDPSEGGFEDYFDDIDDMMMLVGNQVGGFLGYNIPNTDVQFDLVYKLGFNYFYYEVGENHIYSYASGFAFRHNFSLNFRYKVLLINTGFEWHKTKQDIYIDSYGSTQNGLNDVYLDTKIPTGMFKLSIGLIF